jgi:hypothetical protein
MLIHSAGPVQTGGIRVNRPALGATCAGKIGLMEYLALRDGMLQPVTTAGDILVPHGEPFRERPEPRSRSGKPDGVITTDRIPSRCTCSWSYVQGKLTLKYSNTACPVLSEHRVVSPGSGTEDGQPAAGTDGQAKPARTRALVRRTR